MNVYRIIFPTALMACCFALMLCGKATAQTPDLIMSGKAAYENGVHIGWIPLNDTLWGEAMEQGYTLSRTNIATGQRAVLARNLKPRPLSWFEANKQAESGFLYLIGQVLYDADFTGEEKTRDQNRAMQYQYLMYEAQLNPAIAEALGIGFFDTTGVDQTEYRYEVEFLRKNGEKVSGWIELTFSQSAVNVQNPPDIMLEFSPPGGTPLLRMRGDYGQINRIEITAKALGDSIVLRWAPNNPVYWKATRIAGYGLFKEIFTPVPGTDSFAVEFILLDSIYPWPLERFNQPAVLADSMALIAAQCLYGDRMTSEQDGFINQLAESDMRYGMAMLAADRSPLAAQALGLRYVDRKVDRGRVYRYALVSMASLSAFENAGIEVLNVPDTLQRIQGFGARSVESGVILEWSKLNDEHFTGYLLERSDDGGRTFVPLNLSPLLFIDNRYARPDGMYEYRDSIGENYRPRLYRIRGMDSFGDPGATTTVQGMGRDLTPPPTPVVLFAESNLAGAIELRWEMPEPCPDLASFHILVGEGREGPYEPAALNLPPGMREYIFMEPLNTNRSYYFLIAAEDTASNQSVTFPVYVHLIDSFPPAPPMNLGASVDSNGVVTLVWDHGSEPDLIGYRVYVGAHPEHEFAQITVEPTEFNVWYDTLELRHLDKYVYYKVVAEDRSHNHSVFSQTLALKRPDILPPAAPASLPTQSDTEGVLVSWMPSPSNDVAAYVVYRRIAESDTARWQRIALISDPAARQFMDSTAIPEVVYAYAVKAVDESGLRSEFSFAVKGRRSFDPASLSVSSLSAQYQADMKAMRLQWNTRLAPASGDSAADFQYYLYRKIGEGGWVKISQLGSETLSYLDRDLKLEGLYAYAIKIVTSSGKSGALRESPTINYTTR